MNYPVTVYRQTDHSLQLRRTVCVVVFWRYVAADTLQKMPKQVASKLFSVKMFHNILDNFWPTVKVETLARCVICRLQRMYCG